MAQYFDNIEIADPKTYEYRVTIGEHSFFLKSVSGTFSKEGLDDGSRLLLETIFQTNLGEEILDLGCGTGPIGLILAATNPKRHLTLSDVNIRALETAKSNAETLGVTAQVKIVTSDVYHSIDSTFDTIVSNPPIRAGKKVTYAIYDGAPSHLKEHGRLIIVIRRKQGADSVEEHLHTLFNKVEVLASHKGYRVISANN